MKTLRAESREYLKVVVQLEVLHLASMLRFVVLILRLDEGELVAKFADVGPGLLDLLFLLEVLLPVRDLQLHVDLTPNHLQLLWRQGLK